MLVQATYSDGRVEDVTHWAKFSSTDETVAAVDDDGRLKVTGRGEAYRLGLVRQPGRPHHRDLAL